MLQHQDVAPGGMSTKKEVSGIWRPLEKSLAVRLFSDNQQIVEHETTLVALNILARDLELVG